MNLINSQIVGRYTYIDELLSVIICHAYFQRPNEPFNFQRLWRTKKFRAFAHHFLDGVYLLNKMRLVNDLRVIPVARDTVKASGAAQNGRVVSGRSGPRQSSPKPFPAREAKGKDADRRRQGGSELDAISPLRGSVLRANLQPMGASGQNQISTLATAMSALTQ